MKSLLFMISLMLISCNEWQKLEEDRVLYNSGAEMLFTSQDSMSSAQHNLDSGIVTFIVNNFDISRFKELDKIATDKGWCSVNKIRNERLYALPHNENFINAEIINLSLDESTNELYVTIHPM